MLRVIGIASMFENWRDVRIWSFRVEKKSSLCTAASGTCTRDVTRVEHQRATTIIGGRSSKRTGEEIPAILRSSDVLAGAFSLSGVVRSEARTRENAQLIEC